MKNFWFGFNPKGFEKYKLNIGILDQLIKSTSSRANYSIWEIDELSSLHNHKAIVLKKEKRFNEEFIERLKSYSLEGISANLKSASKDISFSKTFVLF